MQFNKDAWLNESAYIVVDPFESLDSIWTDLKNRAGHLIIGIDSKNKYWGFVGAEVIHAYGHSHNRQKPIVGFLNSEVFIELESSVSDILGVFSQTGLGLLPVLDQEGQFVGVCDLCALAKYFVHNSDLLDASQRQLREQISRQSDDVAFLMHDLKGHLAVDLMGCEVLENKETLTESGQLLVNKMKISLDRALRFIADLLDRHRHEQGLIMPLKMKEVNLKDFLRRLINEMNFVAQIRSESRVRLVNCPEVVVLLDEQKVFRALQNIIENAIHYSPEQSTIVLLAEFEAAKNTVTIRIRDEGQGLDQEHLDTIFGKYARVKDSGDVKGGYGLGLTVAKTFVEEHGGSIKVTNQERGLEFVIKFPNAQIMEVKKSKKALKKTSKPEPQILLVDDDDDFLQYFSEQLRGEKFKVITAKNGRDAVEKFALNQVDLVLSDIKMPEMDGFDLWEHICLDDQDVVFAFVTGYRNALSHNQDLILQKVAAIFDKPLKLEDVKGLLKSMNQKNKTNHKLNKYRKK